MQRPVTSTTLAVAPIARSPLFLLAAISLVVWLGACTAEDPKPGPYDGWVAGSEGGKPGTDGSCPVSCKQLACGQYACYSKCAAGSGCTDCAGKPCGSGICHYGAGIGCVCGGQPCVSSGCPPGTGCIP